MRPSRILVTPRSVTKSGHPALQRLIDAGCEVVCCTPGQQPDEAELLRLLPGCVGYLAGVEKITARVLDAAPALKVISRNGVGVDNVDLDAARRLNVRVCTTPGANARGVAELAVGLMLALARNLPACDRALKDGRWERRSGIELQGRTLGVVGCGQIGRMVAAMGVGIGMRVMGFDVAPDAAFLPGAAFRYAGLDEVLAVAEVVSLHCPPQPDGRPLMDGATLAGLRRGALLVNTARASLVDEEAVLAALSSGQLGGFGTDVYAEEPPRDLRLVRHPQVIATPHAGGFTAESVDRAMNMAVENLLKALGS
jgi:D-3-phosphoglycerate dehydrogenase / 2-oxoglutarate reductase